MSLLHNMIQNYCAFVYLCDRFTVNLFYNKKTLSEGSIFSYSSKRTNYKMYTDL